MSAHLLPVNVLVFGNLVLIKASRTLKCIDVTAAKRKSGTTKASGLILWLGGPRFAKKVKWPKVTPLERSRRA
jgi:hypothetical protein